MGNGSRALLTGVLAVCAFRSNGALAFEKNVPTADTTKTWTDSARRNGCVYLSVTGKYTTRRIVHVYDAQPPYAEVGMLFRKDLTAGGYGFAVAAMKDAVYIVSDQGIDVYTPCTISPPTASIAAGSRGHAMAVATDGTIYVSAAESNTIDVIHKGGKYRMTSDPNVQQIFALALDGSGNLFVAGDSEVDVCDPTMSQCAATGISGITFPAGLAVDKHHNLIVNDEGATTLDEYAPPYAASTLVASFQYGIASENNFYTAIALDRTNSTLWAADSFYSPSCFQCLDVQGNSYPLGSLAGATPQIQGNNFGPWAAGVAVWKPSKV